MNGPHEIVFECGFLETYYISSNMFSETWLFFAGVNRTVTMETITQSRSQMVNVISVLVEIIDSPRFGWYFLEPDRQTVIKIQRQKCITTIMCELSYLSSLYSKKKKTEDVKRIYKLYNF